jgi:hypothetical protein
LGKEQEIGLSSAKSDGELELTEEQRVYALRKASIHPAIAMYFKSAGLFDIADYETLRHIVDQMRGILQVARETK